MNDRLDRHPLAGRDDSTATDRGTLGDVLIWISLALGAVLLFAGYWGASDSTDPGKQLPYLASGTAPGLALVIVAGVMVIRREHGRDRTAIGDVTERFDAILAWLASASTPSDDDRTALQHRRPDESAPHTLAADTVAAASEAGLARE